MAGRMIELHDSTVVGIVQVGGQVVVFLDAYMHVSEGRVGWDAGTGWQQAAALTFTGGTIEGEAPDSPSDIWHGDLVVDGEVLSNEIPIPFRHVGSVSLNLHLDVPAEIAVRGSAAELTLIGEPVYVEDFPGAGR